MAARGRTTTGEDTVWALHDFEAENEDELSFRAGERIVVLERDDQYGDGWFQGRNERGEVGLFPQSYTSSRPPSFYPLPTDGLGLTSTPPPASSEGPNTATGTVSPPTPVLTNGSSPATEAPEAGQDRLSPTTAASSCPPAALGTLSSARRLSSSGISVHSRISTLTRDYDDDDDDGEDGVRRPALPADGAAHRAALAARVGQNAEKAAQEERERAARRKKEDEEAYERVRREGLIEGLQLSDESDEDEPEEELRPVREDSPAREGAFSALTKTASGEQGQVANDAKEAAREVVAAGGEAAPAQVQAVPAVPEAAPERPPLLEAQSGSHYPDEAPVKVEEAVSSPAPAPALAAAAEEQETLAELARAASEAEQNEAEEQNRPRADTLSSAYAESTYSQSSSAAPPVPSPPPPAPLDLPALSTSTPSPSKEKSETSPTSPSSVLDSLKSAATSTGAAFTAGATAAAAGVGLAAAHAADGAAQAAEEEKSATATAEVPLPQEAKSVLDAAPTANEATTAQPVDVSAAESAPAPPAPAPIPQPAVMAVPAPSPAAPVVASSLTASPSSAAFSHTHTNGASTAGTSAPASEAGSKGGSGSGKELPADPYDWSVEDVVEWARQKGFDGLTVGKFQEHEISGDVLLEMDVAMLKEIDLVAFGRRVHIYNAIKELKHRTHPELSSRPSNLGSSISSSYLSPALSGYEAGVDSPASLMQQSPTMGSFAAAAAAGQGGVGASQARWEASQGVPYHPGQFQQERLAGLGFDEDSQGAGSLRAPSSLGQQSVSNLRASSRSHHRSTTVDSYSDAPPHSASSHGGPNSASLPAPVPPSSRPSSAAKKADELTTTADEGSTTDAATSISKDKKRDKKASVRPSTAASTTTTSTSFRPKSSRRGTTDGDTTSSPGSPDPSGQRKGSKSGASDREGGGKGFFGGTLAGLPGRSRKPPPRVPSGLLLDSDGAVPRPRPRTSLQDRSKRATRLFGFGGATSGSEKSPTASETVRSRASNSTLGNPREAPTTMKPKEVDPATQAMLREKAEKVTSGNLMDKIGRPDHSGWMRKKGEKYNTWKMRFFVLKGVYLYYLKSEQEQKAKGVIDLTGYRVLSDESIKPGEFGFKIVHDRERPHYFAAAEQITVRTWMKEIMKATILRDYSAPVVSSCDIDVLPLDVAQTMTPYPRPPTPTRRAQIQKERYAGTNPNTLSQKDAAILMDFAPGSPLMNGEALWSTASTTSSKPPKQERKASAVSVAKSATSDTPTEHAAAEPVLGDATLTLNGASPHLGTTRLVRATSDTSKGELLAWVNANLPSSCPLASDLSQSLRSGRLLVRLLENLVGTDSGISDGSFEQFDTQEGLPFDTAYLDTIFSVFDYISPLVSTDDVSMEDMITGNEERLTLLVERIRTKYPHSVAHSAEDE
ncbi:hypothetical protein JCM8097_002239 [Rhodosporidiobolus ruineniae]